MITRRRTTADHKHERSQQLTASVQAPTKYGFAINLETAKALGITMALPLLGRADEVIE